jgi:hypothetical protein
MDRVGVELFAEDAAHELFLSALVRRLATERGAQAVIQVRSARGGHGKVLDELATHQSLGAFSGADLVLVAIDANCSPPGEMRRQIREKIAAELGDRTVIACPDPHVERWYLADPPSLKLGVRWKQQKCERDYYKQALRQSLADAGYVLTLGGIELAEEIVTAMDLFRAGKNEPSLRQLIADLRAQLKVLQP